MAESGKSVIVVGAGIVGVTTALSLQMEGHRVRVIDPKGPGRSTSFGNAGSISVGSIYPTGSPGNFKQLPGMLMDPAAPFAIRWRYLPSLLPWLMRFFEASRPSRVRQICEDLLPLVSGSGDAHLSLMKAHGIEGLVKPLGWLKVYEGEAAFNKTLDERRAMERLGVNIQTLSQDELRQLEPGLSPRFTHAAFQPDNFFCTSPIKLTEAYARAFVGMGGEFLAEKVSRFEMEGDRVKRVITDFGFHEADAVVICAGAWSGRVCDMLGVKVSLDTERGYHLNLVDDGAAKLGRPVVIGNHSFVLAPMQDGIRLTSGVEFAGVDAPPNFQRIRNMLPLAQKALPGLSGDVTREWLGYRPSTPDSKPVIGAAPGLRNVYLGFGHGHLGLSQSAHTGKLLAELISEKKTGIDLYPFRAERFSRGN